MSAAPVGSIVSSLNPIPDHHADLSDRVYRVIGTRRKRTAHGSQRLFLVHWMHQPEYDATWAEEREIKNATAALETFWNERPDHGTSGTMPPEEGDECGAEDDPIPRPQRTRRPTLRQWESWEQQQDEQQAARVDTGSGWVEAAPAQQDAEDTTGARSPSAREEEGTVG